MAGLREQYYDTSQPGMDHIASHNSPVLYCCSREAATFYSIYPAAARAENIAVRRNKLWPIPGTR